jgi:hypothetical protein
MQYLLVHLPCEAKVGGPAQLLAVNKCIYLPPTYLHFIQEHRMAEKHHMNQNPYLSSLCPKPWVVTDNMTRGDDVAQSPGLVEAKWGQLAPPPWPVGQGLASFQNLSSTRVNLSQQEGYPM